MTMPGFCPSMAAPSAGHPPICLADASGIPRHAAATSGALRRLHHRAVLPPRRVGSGPRQHLLPQGADVVVRGYGGYNSRWALFLIQRIFPLVGLPPVATTIFFGANDAALPGRTSQRQHVPVEEYRQNLKTIVNHLKDCSKSMVILLITPPPIDEDGRERYARSLYGEDARRLPERTNEMAGVYAGQCIELAKEMDVHCIDIWSKMQAAEGWQKLYLSDGLHLTPEGNALVHKEVVQALRGAGLKPEDMPHDFPHHSKIDGIHPEKAFQ
ncbi:unnamed protein product [Triticum turgidum subsp. durum]|uniref:SGNH hydrolase-type esterase domain-containing protein n=1 Tax=Triticum turgidum subsp. durum TaxID=4567 RepID=A0A9R0SRG7_TRITD|nr:unnamed protein product [Triticum turgidum subsp. durum]